MCCFNVVDRKERLVLAKKDAIVAYKIMYRDPDERREVPCSYYNTHQKWYKNKTVEAKGSNGRTVKAPTYRSKWKGWRYHPKLGGYITPGASMGGIYSYNKAGLDKDHKPRWARSHAIHKVKIWGVVDVYEDGYLSTRAMRID